MYDIFDYDDPGYDPFVQSESIDTNYDGIPDTFVTVADTNYDGLEDTMAVGMDYNQDGVVDKVTTYTDTNGDNVFDVVTKQTDSNGDGILDFSQTMYDFDGDGHVDGSETSMLFDTDGDGQMETVITQADYNGDGVAELNYATIYDPFTGEVSYIDLDQLDPYQTSYTPLPTWDPANSDPTMVSGDPAQSMEKWECQGKTNRCALFSQKFVIEELTGREIDIEELADLAEQNGWFTEEGGTPMLNMNKVLDYYGVDNQMSWDNSIDDIKECLDKGGKVIVSIDSGEIWMGEEGDDIFSPQDGADHAVEVIGIDYTDPENPMVILNDSGTPYGKGEMVPLAMFEDAWADGDHQMIECYA